MKTLAGVIRAIVWYVLHYLQIFAYMAWGLVERGFMALRGFKYENHKWVKRK